MADDSGPSTVINPQKHISIEIVLDLLLKHKNATYKSYFGQNIGETEQISDNLRILHQAESLREMISSQILIVDLIAMPKIEEDCYFRWNKKNKSKEDKEKNPFEEEENNLKKLVEWRSFLEECLKALRDADESKTLEDDFMIVKTNSQGEKQNYLTENFYEMRRDLALSYKEIYRLLEQHEITSKKEDMDEDLTYKEQEELFMERFEEA